MAQCSMAHSAACAVRSGTFCTLLEKKTIIDLCYTNHSHGNPPFWFPVSFLNAVFMLLQSLPLRNPFLLFFLPLCIFSASGGNLPRFSFKTISVFWQEGKKKKGRCICLCIPVLWQHKICSSLLTNVENRMRSTEQGNPMRTSLMRLKLAADIDSALSSQAAKSKYL